MASPPLSATGRKTLDAIEPDQNYLLRLRAQRTVGSVLTYAAVILVCVLIGAPIFWMVTAAFKTNPEVYTFPPVWWPEMLRWTSVDDIRDSFVNFREAWNKAPFDRWYLNSIIITIGGMTLEIINATLTAYALAFLRFRYKTLVFVIVLAALMVPTQITILPNYLIIGKYADEYLGINGVNTYWGIIIPGAVCRLRHLPAPPEFPRTAARGDGGRAHRRLRPPADVVGHRPADGSPGSGDVRPDIAGRKVERLPLAADRDQRGADAAIDGRNLGVLQQRGQHRLGRGDGGRDLRHRPAARHLPLGPALHHRRHHGRRDQGVDPHHHGAKRSGLRGPPVSF